jgi:1,2-diacylglycerol 3-alpha-glucosyltransferase
MRVALVSTGLGRILRGFESFTESLFQAIRRYAPEFDVTLFQGGGQSSEQRVVVPNFHRADIPSRWFSELHANKLEQRSFALAIYPMLRYGGFDIVHYNELVFGSALFHLRQLFGGNFKLIYCNGAPSPAVHFQHRCDYAQLLTGPQVDEALAFGFPSRRLFAIPYGVDADRFSPKTKAMRSDVRDALGIPHDVLMVLSVAAIKREHKRIDYLIEETAQLGSDVWVVVAGQRTADTSSLKSLAERLMPGRWRFVTWPHERVAELYGAADAFVLCSLMEGLPLVTLEAMLSEVPAVIHNGPVFQWLAQDTSARTIDMSRRGALSATLHSVLNSIHKRSDNCSGLSRSREVAKSRFSWEALIPRYMDMYRQAVQK